MPFIVQGKSPKTGISDFSETITTRNEALKKAVQLQGEGYSAVKIIADGRTYAPMEFAASNVKDQ